MSINKVIYGNDTLIDLTSDTVSENNLLAGATAHAADGSSIEGSVITHNVLDTLESESTQDALSANQGRILNNNYLDLKEMPKPYFVFVDDDGKSNFNTMYTQVLKPRNIVGGLSIVLSDYCIGATGYLTKDEINSYSDLGWDVLCHSTSIDSLVPDTVESVLNFCDNRIAYYGFKDSGIFVYPNGNLGDNKATIEKMVSKHFKYALNINTKENCPTTVPIRNKMDIGRIFIQQTSELTSEIKAYYKKLIDTAIQKNKLIIISTHSNKSDYTYLAEILDYIINLGYSFISPTKAFEQIESYRFQDKIKDITKAEYAALGDSVKTDNVIYNITDENYVLENRFIEVTQAEYDALPEVEKNNYDYFISDGDDIATASVISYNNSKSGLTSTNVQTALDELKTKIGDSSSLKASDISYDNSTSGLNATNLQQVIDMLILPVGTIILSDNSNFSANMPYGTWVYAGEVDWEDENTDHHYYPMYKRTK